MSRRSAALLVCCRPMPLEGRWIDDPRIELRSTEIRRAFDDRVWPRKHCPAPRRNKQQGTLVDEQPASRLPSVFDDGDAYDLVLGGKDVPYGLDFYVALAREANGPVLDVACGTGRILLPCLQAGVDIEGVDIFEPMLSTLRKKAAALGLSPKLHRADMSDFRIGRCFAL